jgi:hypothetical protein
MCDYTCLSDTAQVELHDDLTSGADANCLTDARSSEVKAELFRRATQLCMSLDGMVAACCRLENWSLRVSPDPRNKGAAILAGCVYGHPDFPNGTPILTGPLQIILRTADEDLAVTVNTVYQLSVLDPDYLGALLDGNLL